MEPIASVTMPTHGVMIELTAANSWKAMTLSTESRIVRAAYVATDSMERMSFAGLNAGRRVVQVLSRPAYFADMPHGVVVEVHLSEELGEGETVWISLAQAGATTYYPPQPVDDAI